MTDCTIIIRIKNRKLKLIKKKTHHNVNALSTQMWVPLSDAKNEVEVGKKCTIFTTK